MPPQNKSDWKPRRAEMSDIPAIEALIPVSVRSLQDVHYSATLLDVAIGTVFGVDRQLIRDGTYFIVEDNGQIAGCGGWSRRESLSGGDHGRAKEDALLDPQKDAARVRAFYIHPAWARRGIGRSILQECELAIIAAGFHKVEISATLAGRFLYECFGYKVVEYYDIPMAGGLNLPVVRMTKKIN